MVAADAGPMGIEWSGTSLQTVGKTVQLSALEEDKKWFLRKRSVEAALSWRKEVIRFAATRRGTEHGETREGFEFERAVSCGSEQRWRAQ